jgi:FixJ family two-component response regulator
MSRISESVGRFSGDHHWPVLGDPRGDVSLPDLTGLELQQRIAPDRIDMPIIFITGCADVPMTVQAMKAGAVEFLTKPVREEVLLNAIRHAIERSRSSLDREAHSNTLRDCYATLTRREREVMAKVRAGRSRGLSMGCALKTRKQP